MLNFHKIARVLHIKLKIVIVFACMSIGCGCQKAISPSSDGSLFAQAPLSSSIKAGIVDEASGIADSKTHPGFLWVEQDSGNPPELVLLSHDGANNKKISIKGIQNRDWEDMALGNGPKLNANYIYLADFGDNNLQYSSYFIYRFEEPPVNTDTIFLWDKIIFRYPDGAHDAEAMLLDNDTKDIFIITKRDQKSKVFKLAYPQNTTDTMMAVLMGELPFNGVVSAAFSSDSKEIILKTYTNLYYWKRQRGETIDAVLKKASAALDYKFEPQGEAICFNKENSGFYTLSEKPSLITSVDLNFYKRK